MTIYDFSKKEIFDKLAAELEKDLVDWQSLRETDNDIKLKKK